MYNLMDTLAADPEMSLLRKGLKVTGLYDLLQEDGPFTIFAPTDLSFAQLNNGLPANWQKPHYYAYLSVVLSHHIVRGKIYLEGLENGTMLYSIDGQRLQVSLNADKVAVNNARIIRQDITATNGIMHHVGDVIFNS